MTLDRHCHPVIMDLFYHDSGVKLTMKDTDYVRERGRVVGGGGGGGGGSAAVGSL